MRFVDYVNERNSKRLENITRTFKVPDEMQKLFSIPPEIEENWCITNFGFINNPTLIITDSIIEYLGVLELAQHLVGHSIDFLSKISNLSFYRKYEIYDTVSSSQLLYNLIESYNKLIKLYQDKETMKKYTIYDSEEYKIFDIHQKMWEEKVIEPFIDAIFQKLESPIFSDDEDNTDGASYCYTSEDEKDYGSGGVYIVNEETGQYSDRDVKTIAVFDTKHKARKFVKRIRKTYWSSKAKIPYDECKSINKKLVIGDYDELSRYTILSRNIIYD